MAIGYAYESVTKQVYIGMDLQGFDRKIACRIQLHSSEGGYWRKVEKVEFNILDTTGLGKLKSQRTNIPIQVVINLLYVISDCDQYP